jgi:toxin ParE1/3/4
MARIRFSRRARKDLQGITAYTVQNWSEDQAGRYTDKIQTMCESLAASPVIGKPFRANVRTMACGRHVIYHRAEGGGIFVLRVLHDRMLPTRHDIETN